MFRSCDFAGTLSFVEPACLLFAVRRNAPSLLGFSRASTASSTAWWHRHNPCSCKSATGHHTSPVSNETREGSCVGPHTTSLSLGSNTRPQTTTQPSLSPETKSPGQVPCTKNPAASPLHMASTAAHDAETLQPPSSIPENENEADLLEETKKVFGQMDVNKSGIVAEGELQVALTRLGLPSSQVSPISMFQCGDFHGYFVFIFPSQPTCPGVHQTQSSICLRGIYASAISSALQVRYVEVLGTCSVLYRSCSAQLPLVSVTYHT